MKSIFKIVILLICLLTGGFGLGLSTLKAQISSVSEVKSLKLEGLYATIEEEPKIDGFTLEMQVSDISTFKEFHLTFTNEETGYLRDWLIPVIVENEKVFLFVEGSMIATEGNEIMIFLNYEERMEEVKQIKIMGYDNAGQITNVKFIERTL